MTPGKNRSAAVGLAIIAIIVIAVFILSKRTLNLEPALRYQLGSSDKVSAVECRTAVNATTGECAFHWSGSIDELMTIGRLKAVDADAGAARVELQSEREQSGDIILRRVVISSADGQIHGSASFDVTE